MFGTIRKHQTWLWAVIITLTIISFVIYFGPQSRVNSGRGGGSASLGTINGDPITEEEFRDANRDVYLSYFFMSGGSFPNSEEARKSGGAWPPQAGVRPIRQENKLLVPAAFSPVR